MLRRDVKVYSESFEMHKKDIFFSTLPPLGKGNLRVTGSSSLALLCGLEAGCLPSWACMVPPVNWDQGCHWEPPVGRETTSEVL